jgi:radical SAM protein with 4Fe4S-binding SPASM domain
MTDLPKFDRTLRNLVLLGDDLSSGRLVWQSRPLHLEFSSNNICNLRCVMCPQHDGLPVQKAEPAFAEVVLDAVLPSAVVLQPFGLSEPLTGDIDLFMRKCEEHDAFLHLVTNGTLLTEERLRRVMPRLHRLYISFETFDKEVFEELRVNASYDKVLANIQMSLRVAAEFHVPVALVTILMRPIAHELPEFVRRCHAIGCNDIVVLELLDTYPRYEDHRVAGKLPMAELVELRDAAIGTACELGMNIDFNMAAPLRAEHCGRPLVPRFNHAELAQRFKDEYARQYGHFCQHAAHYMKVATDGTVYPCCRAPEELVMGNLHERSPAEIWNGPEYQDLRQRMQTGDLPECCKTCAVLIGTEHYRTPDQPAPGALEAGFGSGVLTSRA